MIQNVETRLRPLQDALPAAVDDGVPPVPDVDASLGAAGKKQRCLPPLSLPHDLIPGGVFVRLSGPFPTPEGWEKGGFPDR